MSTKTLDVSVLVHTPQESASNYVQWAKRIRQEPGIRWGVPYIDEVVIPMRGGDLVAFVARPGHCKTSMMMRQAMQVAQEIMRRDEQDQKAVAVVTYEQCQEELENFIQSNQTFSSTDVAWGRVPEDQLIQQVKNRADLPLWVIGHSMARAGTKKPAMTPETVLDAIKYIQDKHQRQVVLMTFDYVQLIPVTGGGSKTEQVTAAVPMIKNLALEIGAPAIIAVQASRDVDSLKFKIPQMHHAQWASIIEQACDKVFSFWRPWQTEEQGATINLGPTYGNEQPVSANLLIVAMLKQRFGLGHKIWPMYFDPAYLKLAQMEFYHGDLLEDDEYGV